jgi:hypothetical protein
MNTMNPIMNRIGAAFLAAFLILTGCDTTNPSTHDEELVVEAYLVAEEALPAIWLSRSIDIDATWSSGPTAVNEADVRLELLAADGSVEETFEYRRTFEAPGMFVTDMIHTVQPLRTYRLVAESTGLPSIMSETTVPEAFDVLEISHQTIEYQDPEQFSFLVTQSRFADRQSIFVFTIANSNPVPDNLVPAYRELFFDKEERESGEPLEFEEGEQEELARFTSPPINEGNYDILPNGSLRVRLPWFAVAFYGETEVTMSVLDDNLYDFQRYQQVQQDGGLLSPGEIPNVLDPIEGGAGVFGSMARVGGIVNILPKDD